MNPRRACPPLLLLLSLACAAHPSERVAAAGPAVRTPPAAQALPASAARRTAEALPAQVRVWLRAHEGQATLGLELDNGQRIEVSRQGQELRASDGQRGARLSFRAGARGLGLAGQRYLGALEFSAASHGGLHVENSLAFEDYIAGVVPGEVALWSAAPALLEAQAIAARTYAAWILDERAARGDDSAIADDSSAQAYTGQYVAGTSPAARQVAERLAAAVEHTRAQVLLDGEAFLEARFCASCGGGTAAAAEVFGARGGSLGAVDCQPCREDAVAWSVTVPRAELLSLWSTLGLSSLGLSLAPTRSDASGRWLELELGSQGKTRRMSFEEFRQRLGTERIKSGLIERCWPAAGSPIQGGLFLAGRGFGHGVGLCQAGAQARAQQGWSSARILEHYYPGSRLARLPVAP